MPACPESVTQDRRSSVPPQWPASRSCRFQALRRSRRPSPVSGLPASQITYVGFLPRRQSQRKRMLQTLWSAPGVLVAFEAPHRLLRTLSAVLETLGDRQIAACREMTKIHEEVFRGSISEAIAHFSNPRGEFTLVIAGSEGGQEPDSDEEALALASRLRPRVYARRRPSRQLQRRRGSPGERPTASGSTRQRPHKASCAPRCKTCEGR